MKTRMMDKHYIMCEIITFLMYDSVYTGFLAKLCEMCLSDLLSI